MTYIVDPKDRAAVANALAGDSVTVAARLIVVNGLMAESATKRGDFEEAFAKFRLVADALEQARECFLLAGRIAR